MDAKTERGHEERGLSARHLALVFLAGVAVCAVFFSLGFLVGSNQRAASARLETERVVPPAIVPPLVNPPPRPSKAAGKAPTTTALAERASSVPEQLGRKFSGQPAASAERSLGSTGAAPAGTSSGAAQGPTRPQAGAGLLSQGEVKSGFTIQVAASHARQDAETLVKILKARGYPVFLVSPEYAHTRDDLYRVQVGPFGSRQEAERVRARLVQEGFKKPFIRQ